MSEVQIRELTGDSWLKAGRLKVGEAQANFVAPNRESIAWSRYESDLIPAGIYDGDEVVGFVLYGRWPGEPNRWGIARYMIDVNQQGKGYGKAGMQEVIRMIREKHPEATGLKLGYLPENDVARKLYSSFGFRETGEMWDDQVIAALDFEQGEATSTEEQAAPQPTTEQTAPKEVTVQPLNIENWFPATELSVLDDQKSYVAPNIHSVAISRFLPDWIPAGIYAGDELVGFTLYGPHEREEGDKKGWHIMRYMIDKTQQGKGYGKAALQAVVDDIKLREPDVEYIDLSVVPENTRAIHVYETLGFALTGKLHWGEAVMHKDV